MAWRSAASGSELPSHRDGCPRRYRNVGWRRITSDANINQLVARALATEAIDEATALLVTFEADFSPWVGHVCGGDTLAAGAALSRLDEALHKWDIPLSAMSALFDQCEAVRRDVDDQWPDLSLDGLVGRRAALQSRLRAPIARVATHVDVDMNPDRPDVFGWAFCRAHQDLLEDVLSDRPTVSVDIEVRLRGLVVATDRASGRLRATVQRQHDWVLGSFWSEPVLMLLQLSGVALVTGSARQRSDLLDVFEQVWGELLDADAQKVLDAALAALVMDDALVGLSPGKINRSGRHQQAFEVLAAVGAPLDDLEFGDLEDSHPELSTRLATMLRHVAHGDFEDVFVAAWMVPEARRRGASVPDNVLRTRLSNLIEAFVDTSEDETRRQADPDTPDRQADAGEED
jgi:hypothetical protein